MKLRDDKTIQELKQLADANVPEKPTPPKSMYTVADARKSHYSAPSSIFFYHSIQDLEKKVARSMNEFPSVLLKAYDNPQHLKEAREFILGQGDSDFLPRFTRSAPPAGIQVPNMIPLTTAQESRGKKIFGTIPPKTTLCPGVDTVFFCLFNVFVSFCFSLYSCRIKADFLQLPAVHAKTTRDG